MIRRLFMVCHDANNGTTYYVNYGNDNYIYELKDGISTLLIDMEAICLQLLNNELYFVAIRIFTCNLSTGEIKYYDYQLVDFGSGNHIQALFTDGKNVYVVMQTYGQDRL